MLNFLKKAFALPHKGQRLYALTLNFGLRAAFTIIHVFATYKPP